MPTAAHINTGANGKRSGGDAIGFAVLIIAEFAATVPFLILVATVENYLFSTKNAVFPAFVLWGAVTAYSRRSGFAGFLVHAAVRTSFLASSTRLGNVLGRACANLVGSIGMPESNRG